MAKPRVIILRSAGINCDEETRHAWMLAGADVSTVHLEDAIGMPTKILESDILTLPGGFSFGDDIAAGVILASRLRNRLLNAMRELVARGGLILGICNGFQVLVKIGLFDASAAKPSCTLTANASGLFTCRWVTLEATSSRCVFLDAKQTYFLPIAHAEGRFVSVKPEGIDEHRIALRYAKGIERVGDDNPNGSESGVAALTDETGRILGMMPHPERYVRHTQHPFWTAIPERDEPDGLAIFRAAVSNCR
ncbi:MAG: phosphoribosylformylglycinamidine synthase subunit PurQ [Planctomycetes bacterium]|nr:phosphoribosylformylglycinamidine synthase subunit PurQ [Planctomycetota bacterium]